MDYTKSHPNYCELNIPSYTKGLLKLIEPKIEYAKISLNWTSNPEIVQYMGGDFSNPSIEKELERLQKIIETTDEYNWNIELNGAVIGAVAINKIKEESDRLGAKTGNLVILIGEKQHWGKGIGHHTLQSVLDWAFRKVDFKIITARALRQNIGSLKVLSKLGLVKIGETPYEDGLIDGQPATWVNFKLEKEKYLI